MVSIPALHLWRMGRRVLALLLALALVPHAVHRGSSSLAPLLYPADALVSVETYHAYGNDTLDDTAAIQAALNDGRSIDQDYFGRPKALFFPAGTYIVSAELVWRGCCVTLQGQGSGVSVIKLADGTAAYQTPDAPKAVIKTPAGNMSFRQNIYGLTINTGANNPGAIGIDYIANNNAAVQDVSIISADGQGVAGLDMSRDWPGPCLISRLRVEGFTYGIRTTKAEYGPTFEQITLRNQRTAGILNTGNTLAIRGLASTNTVPAYY